jgi:hypothetical protein
MTRLARSLLIALLACASFAHADSLRLLAPANGATLRGGSFAEVRWSATQLPKATEEWEAFLSIDGGKYYAFRVTPHLDIDLQRFTFIVPNVDTRKARILIRTGNEKQETLFESPASFSIVRDANAEQVLPRLLHFGRGEAAREGDPAVIQWAAGERNGSGVAQQSSTTVPSRSLRARTTTASDAPPILTPAGKRITSTSFENTPPAAYEDKYAGKSEQLARSVDLLLVCRRRNI